MSHLVLWRGYSRGTAPFPDVTSHGCQGQYAFPYLCTKRKKRYGASQIKPSSDTVILTYAEDQHKEATTIARSLAQAIRRWSRSRFVGNYGYAPVRFALQSLVSVPLELLALECNCPACDNTNSLEREFAHDYQSR